MASIKLPFIDVQRARDGHVRFWYFRRNGCRWRLPGDPLSEAFAAEYQRLLLLKLSPLPCRCLFYSLSRGLFSLLN